MRYTRDLKELQSYKILYKRQEIFNQLEQNKVVNKKDFAYWMRNNPTFAEQEMKKILDNIGERFYRQVIIEPYIVDFMYKKYNLVIEVDGPLHDRNRLYDIKRDEYLKTNKKITILHFSLEDIHSFPEMVDDRIRKTIEILKERKNNKNLY